MPNKLCNLSLFKSFKTYSIKGYAVLISFYVVLTFGCIYQLYHICELYLRYPTIVSTETEFIYDNNQLPAFSICGNIVNSTEGLTINETYVKLNSKKFIKESRIGTYFIKEQNITKDINDSVIFSMNTQYFCYTINSKLKCMYFFYNISRNF